jgi:hypothetical protein
MIVKRLSFAACAVALVLAPAAFSGADSYERAIGNANPDAGGDTTAVRSCPGGGVLTVGSSRARSGPTAIYAVRTGSDGAILWGKTYSFARNVWATRAVEASNGSGFVIAGGTTDANWDSQVAVTKVGCDGTPVWANVYPAPVKQFVSMATAIKEAQNGELVIAGYQIDVRNDRDKFTGLLLRIDASGALLWSRAYDGGEIVIFTSLAEVSSPGRHGERDLVVAGYRWIGNNDVTRPLVLRVGPDGRTEGAGHCAVDYRVQGWFLALTELQTAPHTGEFVVGGYLAFDGGAFVVRTGANACTPLAEAGFRGVQPTAIEEVHQALPDVPAGSLAIAGTGRVGAAGSPTDALLLTLTPRTLTPLTGRLFGDHSKVMTLGTDEEAPNSIVPLSDGFILGGDSQVVDINFDSADLYVVRTNDQGHTGCDLTWKPRCTRPSIGTRAARFRALRAGLTQTALTGFTIADQTEYREPCR